jgi:hypothetical protein
MTHNEIILAEIAARQEGNMREADRLRALRWQRALGLIVNTENTGHAPARLMPRKDV